jgi:hypothetical protein
MSEREKKDEMVLKQRAELQSKQNVLELNPAVEKQIESEIIIGLQYELSKLLVDELETTKKNIKINQNNVTNSKSFASNRIVRNSILMSSNVVDLFDNDLDNLNVDNSFINDSTQSSSVNGNNVFEIRSQIKLEALTDGVNIDDEVVSSVSNEFAAELLYLIKTSKDLCG